MYVRAWHFSYGKKKKKQEWDHNRTNNNLNLIRDYIIFDQINFQTLWK